MLCRLGVTSMRRKSFFKSQFRREPLGSFLKGVFPLSTQAKTHRLGITTLELRRTVQPSRSRDRKTESDRDRKSAKIVVLESCFTKFYTFKMLCKNIDNFNQHWVHMYTFQNWVKFAQQLFGNAFTQKLVKLFTPNWLGNTLPNVVNEYIL